MHVKRLLADFCLAVDPHLDKGYPLNVDKSQKVPHPTPHGESIFSLQNQKCKVVIEIPQNHYTLSLFASTQTQHNLFTFKHSIKTIVLCILYGENLG